MASKNVLVAIKEELYSKAKKKSEKLNYKSIQEYINELIRRDVNRKKVGGRPAEKFPAARLFTMKKVLTTKGGHAFKI